MDVNGCYMLSGRISESLPVRSVWRFCPKETELQNDRENGYQKKTKTISGVEFLKRFLYHIVPTYFRRIRHLGFLSSRSKRQSLAAIRKSLGQRLVQAAPLSRAQVLELCFGERSLLRCRDCGGELQLLETWPKERAPPVNAEAGIC